MAVEIDPSYMKHKKGIQKGMFICFRILSYFIALLLFYILGFIIVKGISVINWDFLTQAPTDGMTKGGIWPAIVGTFYLMIGSALFSFPVGVMSGIYMNEYAPKGKLVNFIRTMTNNLAGIPSIVFGLFGMAFFVNYLDFGDSIIAGSLTLGLLALPIVIRTTEEAFKDIPTSYRPYQLSGRKSGTGSHQGTDHLESVAADGDAPHHHGINPFIGTCVGRNSSYPLYVCSLLLTEIAVKRLRPMYGTALSLVCNCHQRYRHRSTNPYRLRHSFCTDSHRINYESAG